MLWLGGVYQTTASEGGQAKLARNEGCNKAPENTAYPAPQAADGNPSQWSRGAFTTDSTASPE
ncbi:hypothetical protein [Haloactinospora alba]|nr:hypothetical protein [Haloactinospora alba]